MSYEERLHPRPTGWVGWILFASCVMIVNGLFTSIEGLAGIFRDETFFVAQGEVLVLDYTAWGWIHLLLGLAMIATGVLVYKGSFTARLVAIGIVVLNLLAQFTWIGAYPWWSLIAITLDILILYALVVHGAEMDAD